MKLNASWGIKNLKPVARCPKQDACCPAPRSDAGMQSSGVLFTYQYSIALIESASFTPSSIMLARASRYIFSMGYSLASP